ncbi:MAG: type I-E CRISPR-associated protein Cse1/CasA [Pyrinomonadaceae bacterium]
MFSFNLLEEKWIPCVMNDNALRDLSLREVLLDASSVREIVGDSPPVTIALHRLLLAILHRALNAPQSADEWNNIRESGKFNTHKIEKYLGEWKHRFDLFDEKFPFYQTKSLENYSQNNTVFLLGFQAKANAALFDHSNSSQSNPIEAEKVVRMLLGLQSFDFGGTKTSENGKESVSPSPLIQSAVCLVRGNNLFETLLLNLHHYSSTDGEPFPFKFTEDLPAWERQEEPKAEERLPKGYADLLTWQSRRVYLKAEKSEETGKLFVKDAVVMRGYSFPKQFLRNDKETMSGFEKHDIKGYVPTKYEENKSLWRNSFSLFQSVDGLNSRPKTLNWLSELVYEGFLDKSQNFHLEIYGLNHDLKNIAKLLFWQKESFRLPLAYLTDEKLVSDLKTAIEFAEEIGKHLKSSVNTLAFHIIPKPKNEGKEQASKTDWEKARILARTFQAMPVYWSTLELDFQHLLSNLPTQKEAAMREWFAFVLKTAAAD